MSRVLIMQWPFSSPRRLFFVFFSKFSKQHGVPVPNKSSPRRSVAAAFPNHLEKFHTWITVRKEVLSYMVVI